MKSYILTTKEADGPSYRFQDYAQLRRKLEQEGALPPSPKTVGAGTWKFSFTQDGIRHDGVLEATLEGAAFAVHAKEVDGETWCGRGTRSPPQFGQT